jgi:fibronectin type 3 domain-containing protein
VVSDQNGAFTLRRFDSGGALLAEVPLSNGADHSNFAVASDPAGDAWVTGGTKDGGPNGFGVWHVSGDGQTLISSAAFYGAYDRFSGGIAVDASSHVWISAPEVTSAGFTVKFGLWRFEYDGSLSAGFPIYQQRPGGVIDGGLSIAVDSSGDVWSAGVSSNPASAAFDLALWRFDPSGALRPGFPVYRGSAFASIDQVDAGIVIAAGQKVWVTASQLFPGCADKQQALFRFDRDGTVEQQRYWHNTAENASNGRSMALASDGSPWVIGRSADATAVWSYDRFGVLAAGYPRTDSNLQSDGIALDAGDVPWVMYNSTPGAFVGAQTIDGAAGLPSCAQLSGGTVDGSVTVAGGAPAGSSVTIVASGDGFQSNPFIATFLSTGGASVPFTVELETPGDYSIGAFLGEHPDRIEISTPIGFYHAFTPVSLAPGASAMGIDFTIALDTVLPVNVVTFPVAGSTVAALPFFEGSATDANGLNQDFKVAVQDTDVNLWWDDQSRGWIASASPVTSDANVEFTGPPNAVDWTVRISSVDGQSFGRLDEHLVHGHRYHVLTRINDFVGNSGQGETTFTWNGATGDVGAPPPSGLTGQALGISSIAWSWNASQGATAYFLATSTYTAPFASVTATSFADTGLPPAENRRLCVAGVNLLAAGPYTCALADVDAAVPGAVVAASVGSSSVTWSWTNGGNGAGASYELTLSTDGFAANVSTPLPVGYYFRGTSFQTSGLNSNTVYTARLRAYNGALKLSGYSASGSTRTVSVGPDAPANLTGVVDRGAGAVSLSWSPSAASYRVYRGTLPAALSLIASAAGASYADHPGASAFYYYAVSGVGGGGDEGFLSGAISVRFDATPPQITLLQPADGTTLSRPYTIMAQASDDFTSATVRFDIDGIARATTTVTHLYFWDIRNETDGLHSVRAVATDDDGNQATLVHSVTVAYSTPAAPVINGPFDGFSGTPLVFNVNGSGPLLTSVRVLAGAVVIGTASVDGTGSWSLPSAALPGYGDFVLTAVAYETRGESSASSPVHVAAFTQAPTEPGPVSAAVDRAAARVNLSWSASTGTTPVLLYRIERATAAAGSYGFIASTPTTSYSDAPFFSGNYRYRVRAEHGSGLLSAFVSTLTLYDLIPPSAVADLRVLAYRSAQNELDLTWTAASDDFAGVARQLLVRSPSGRFDADSSTTALPAAVAGSTATYTVAVATEAAYFRVYTEDAADNRSAASNTAIYDPVPPRIVSVSLADGEVLSRPRLVNVTATDDIGVTRLVFLVNGSTEADVGQSFYSFYWDIRDWTDGDAEFEVDAYDASGNKASVVFDETINYAPPSAPVITSPVQTFSTIVATITVIGTAENGVSVALQVNGLDVATTSVVNGVWSFNPAVLPAEDDIALTAIASEPQGFSAPSTAVHGVYSASAPNAPESINAETQSGGQARILWSPPSNGKTPNYYRVYSSTDDTLMVEGEAPRPSLLRADRVSTVQFIETPAADGLYFYGMSSVDGAGNESALSAVVYVFTDRVAPTGAIEFSTAQPVGSGVYYPLLSLSEPLAFPPLLTFTPTGGQPSPLSLEAVTATLWRATVTIDASMGEGSVRFAFQGTDLAGNVGTALSSSTLFFDTVGPVGSISLSRSSPVKAGPLTFTLTLNERAPIAPGLALTASGGLAEPLTVVAASTDGRVWTASAQIGSANDGMAVLALEAVDQVGNLGATISSGGSFIVDTAAPGAPVSVRANPIPAGRVVLSWSAALGEGATYYRIYRDGGLIADFVAPLPDGSGAYTDSPSEGQHSHVVSAVDAAGNESPFSSPASVSVADATPPPVPVNLTAVINGFGQVELGWQSASTDTASYRLYRATHTILSLEGLSPRVALPPFVDAPSLNAVYYYAVTARDTVGNESAPSATASLSYTNAPLSFVFGGIVDGGHFKTAVQPVIQVVNGDSSMAQARLDGQPFIAGSTVSAEGFHVLVAEDTLGHHVSSTATFTLDFTSPQLAFSIAEGAAIVSTTPVSVGVTITELYPAASSFLLENADLGTSVIYNPGGPISRNGRYTLTASVDDRAGNRSTAALHFSVEFGPAAPSALSVVIQNTARISWQSPEPGIVGYRIYRDGVRVSASLNQGLFFEDSSWTPGAHVYEISAIDSAGVEGPRARASVPAAMLGFNSQQLTRGFFDALHPTVQNGGATALTIGPAFLSIADAAGNVVQATAAPVSVAPGQTGQLEGVIATPVALGPSTVHVVVQLPTDAGASLSVSGDFVAIASDPQQPLLEVLPGALVQGTFSPVQVRLYNRGSAPLDVVTAQVVNSTFASVDNVKVQLQTPEGALIASSDIQQTGNGANSVLVGNKQLFIVTIPPGSSFLFDPVRLTVPNTLASILSVVASVSTPTFNLPIAAIPGGRGFTSSVGQAIVQQIPYQATAWANKSFYDQGSTVTLFGVAADSSGFFVANASVTVHILSNGFDRTASAVTDAAGSYVTTFFPLPNEAGAYSIFAGHPALVNHIAQSSFSIVGFAYGFSSYSASVAQNSSVRFSADLINTGATPLDGLSGSAASVMGTGVTLSLDAASLPTHLEAGARAVLNLTIAATPTASSSTPALTVHDGHGFFRTLPISVTVIPAQAIPDANPQFFEIGMLGGQTRTQAITLTNKGFDTWRGVNLSSPTLDWVHIQGLLNLGDIPPGGNANFSVSFEPPVGLPTGTYAQNPLLNVFSLNATTIPINVGIAITSSKQGGIAFSVINADKPRSGAGQGVPVSNVVIILTSLENPGLTFTLNGDSNGIAQRAAVPSGSYSWRATATQFQPKSGVVTVDPGLSKSIEIPMFTATVTYAWTVTPTQILDKYDVSLNLTLKTDVPAPALIVDPPMITLVQGHEQTTYAQYTLKNIGLVSAFNVTFKPQIADGIDVVVPFTSIPELRPQQSIVVPLRITTHSPPCGVTRVVHDAVYTCALGVPGECNPVDIVINAGLECASVVGPMVPIGIVPGLGWGFSAFQKALDKIATTSKDSCGCNGLSGLSDMTPPDPVVHMGNSQTFSVTPQFASEGYPKNCAVSYAWSLTNQQIGSITGSKERSESFLALSPGTSDINVVARDSKSPPRYMHTFIKVPQNVEFCDLVTPIFVGGTAVNCIYRCQPSGTPLQRPPLNGVCETKVLN